MTAHRPPAARPSAPQVYQCLLLHFLATLGAQEKADCTSMLSSIDSCQNRVSADQYHLTVARTQVSAHQGWVFFEVIRWQFTRFQMITGSCLLFFNIHIKNFCVYVSIATHYYDFDFKLTSDAKIQPVFFLNTGGKTFSNHGHVLVTLHVQFLCSDWLKFDSWVHA